MKKEQKMRERAWNETSGHCVYCGHPVSREEMELDHIEPRWLGGSDKFSNLVCSCHACNEQKGGRPLEEVLPEWSEKRLRRYLNRIETWVEQGKMSLEKSDALTPICGLPDKEDPEDFLPFPDSSCLPGNISGQINFTIRLTECQHGGCWQAF